MNKNKKGYQHVFIMALKEPGNTPTTSFFFFYYKQFFYCIPYHLFYCTDTIISTIMYYLPAVTSLDVLLSL